MTLFEMERRMIEEALIIRKGNMMKAAMDLGIARASIYRKVKQHGITVRGPNVGTIEK